MNTLKKPVILTLGSILLVVFTYINFTQYKPKVIRQLPDVKAASTTTETLGFQIPRDAEKLSINKSADFNQVIFETKKKKTEVQDFYKTVYSEPKWRKINESAVNDFVTSRYKSDNATVTITTFDLNVQDNTNNTLVSLEEKSD